MTAEWEQFMELASRAFARGALDECEMHWKAALQAAERFGENDGRLAKTLEGLAIVYWNQQKLQEAESLCIRALNIYTNAHGPTHQLVGATANKLAVLYHTVGRLPEAEMKYHQALNIKAKNLGTDHPEVSEILNNYSMLLKAQGRDEEMRRLHASLKQGQPGAEPGVDGPANSFNSLFKNRQKRQNES